MSTDNSEHKSHGKGKEHAKSDTDDILRVTTSLGKSTIGQTDSEGNAGHTAGPPNLSLQPGTADDSRFGTTDLTAMEILGIDELGIEPTLQKLPPRPRFNAEGRQVSVWTNHFKLDSSDVDEIWVHKVSIVANYERKTGRDSNGIRRTERVKITPNLTRRILTLLLDQENQLNCAATDYAYVLVSTKKVVGSDGTRDWRVLVPSGVQTQTSLTQSGNQGKRFTVTIEEEGILSLRQLRDYLASNATTAVLADKQKFLNAMNLLISRRPNQDLGNAHVRKSRHFDVESQRGKELGNGLIAYYGYERSVRTSQSGLLLQIKGTAAAFHGFLPADRKHEELTISWLIHRSWPIENYCHAWRRAIDKFVRGIKVRARHTGIHYTVCGLATVEGNATAKPAPGMVTFMFDTQGEGTNTRNTQRISVLHYMRQVKQITDYIWPEDLVLNVGTSTRSIYVPAGLLEVVKGIPYRGLLDGQQTQNMLTFACKSGTDTKDLVLDEGRRMFGTQLASSNTFTTSNGLKFQGTMLSIDARRLDGPWLLYGGGKRVDLRVPRNAAWNMQNLSCLQAGSLQKWTLVEVTANTGTRIRWCNEEQVRKLETALEQGIRSYCPQGTGVSTKKTKLNNPKCEFSLANAKSTMKNFFEHLKRQGIQLIFVILHNKDATIYETLKYVADVEVGIHTICTVRNENWNPSNDRSRQFKTGDGCIANLMLKFNLKMGGKNNTLSFNAGNNITSLLSPSTIILGADVTHMSPGSMKETPSIAAVVGSVKADFAQYLASIRCQTTRTEMIEDLDAMVVERLLKWSEANDKRLPNQILFYRDGVSEGEFGKVVEVELPKIKKAIAQLYTRVPPPKLMLICMVKRTATRFFAQGSNGIFDDGRGNLLSGFLIDRGVTHERNYDWYLQSHATIQGTAKPTHYVVLHDEIGVAPEIVHRATYWQCFTFGRCCRAISIHPAARYADRACNRARAYLREFLVAGDRAEQVFDRSSNARNAWRDDSTIKLRDSMFYI